MLKRLFTASRNNQRFLMNEVKVCKLVVDRLIGLRDQPETTWRSLSS